MDQIDRNRRRAAGRKVLLDAGISDEQAIEAVLASPEKKPAETHHAARPAVPAHPVDQVAPAQLPRFVRRIIRAQRPQAAQPQINQPRQPPPHVQPQNAPRNNAAYYDHRQVQVQQHPAAQLNNNQALLRQPQVPPPIAPHNNAANGPHHVAFAGGRLQPALRPARDQPQGFAPAGEGQFGADRRPGEARQDDGDGRLYEARNVFAQQAQQALEQQIDYNRRQRIQLEARLRNFQQNPPLGLFDAAEEDVLRARINAYMTANRMLQERYDRYDRLRAGNM